MHTLVRGLVLTTALALAACSSPATDGSPTASTPVAVATTTQLGSILGDIASCASATSTTIMGPGDDPHTFAISSAQMAEMARAKLVVASGLGLEGGLTAALDNARADGADVLEVAPQLDPLTWEQEGLTDDHSEESDHEEGSDHDEEAEHGEYDPHVHLDASRMARAATLIGTELARVTGDDQFTACGQQVHDALEATHAEVISILAAVPAERRVLVVDHQAYGYFARAYGFTVAGAVIPSGSTEAEPSSAELAALVSVINEHNLPAIFSNSATNPALVEAVAQETGRQVAVVELYEDSLGPAGSGADTYSGMMLTNAHRIADALS